MKPVIVFTDISSSIAMLLAGGPTECYILQQLEQVSSRRFNFYCGYAFINTLINIISTEGAWE